MKKKVTVFFTLLMLSIIVQASSFAAALMPPDHSSQKSGWIGIIIRDLKNNDKTRHGAYVSEVVENSPADSAGIETGDIVIRFADKDIAGADDLKNGIQQSAPGEKKSLVAIRDGEEKKFIVTIGKHKTITIKRSFHESSFPAFPMLFHERILGLKLLSLNYQLAEYFGIPDGEGVLVQEVRKKSTGADVGLKAGDVIIRFGKRSVSSIEDILHELKKYDEGDTVQLNIIRKGQTKTFSVELQENDVNNHGFQFFMQKPHMQYFENNDTDDENMNHQSEEE